MTTPIATTFHDGKDPQENAPLISEARAMYPKLTTHNQEGFTVIEMMVAVTIMIIVSAGVFSLMKSSMTIATASYEMTDAQENLRIAQEYINRDLMNAGDG